MIQKATKGDQIFDFINNTVLGLIALTCLYPFWYVLMSSLSDADIFAVKENAMLVPLGFSLRAYDVVFKNPNVISGYYNTIIYVVLGTAINMFMTTIGAYALSRKTLAVKKVLMVGIVFTMYFGGGLIPNFLLVKNLGLYNTRWALMIPQAIGTWNLIIMRTVFNHIPVELEESARIDGGNDLVILFRIFIPVAKATMAVMILFYSVSHWNGWFGAMIYLRDVKLKPLQLFLREILISQSVGGNTIESEDTDNLVYTIRHATIIVATVPILCIYPFIQKYFIRGIMMGSLKG